MKVQPVYPSAIMKIACPHCGAQETLKNEKPPQKDFQLSCPQCKETFLVKLNVRKFYRKEVSIPVIYTLLDSGPSGPKGKAATIVDLSREGMCVECREATYAPGLHREGNLFQLSFSLPPRGEALRVQGELMRVNRREGAGAFTLGIKFRNLDAFASQCLGFFLLP